MSTRECTMLSLLFAAFSLAIWGCGSPADTPQTMSDMHDGQDRMDGMDHGDAASVIDPDTLAQQAATIEASLASLSAEDRASAERQGVCVYSNVKLGVMGEPIKLNLDGEDVWICCPDCRDEVTADPEKYLAKLHELIGPKS